MRDVTRGVLLGANLHCACRRLAVHTGVHRVFLPARTESEVMYWGAIQATLPVG